MNRTVHGSLVAGLLAVLPSPVVASVTATVECQLDERCYAVPEPGTLLLIGTGIVALGGLHLLRRRSRRLDEAR